MKKRLRKKLEKRELARRGNGWLKPLTPQRITLDTTFASMLAKGEIGVFSDVRFVSA